MSSRGLSSDNNIYYSICCLVSKLFLSDDIADIEDLDCFDNIKSKIGKDNFEEYIHSYIKYFIDEITYYFNGRKLRPFHNIVFDDIMLKHGYKYLKNKSKVKFNQALNFLSSYHNSTEPYKYVNLDIKLLNEYSYKYDGIRTSGIIFNALEALNILEQINFFIGIVSYELKETMDSNFAKSLINSLLPKHESHLLRGEIILNIKTILNFYDEDMLDNCVNELENRINNKKKVTYSRLLYSFDDMDDESIRSYLEINREEMLFEIEI